MTQRTSDKLAFAGKLLLVAAGIAAVAASVVMIILNARESHAQSKAETLSFEVASIKASCPEPRPTRRSGAPDRCLNYKEYRAPRGSWHHLAREWAVDLRSRAVPKRTRGDGS